MAMYSSSSSMGISAQPSFMAAPMTIMYSTTGASSTIPEIGTNTASPPSLTTLLDWSSIESEFKNPFWQNTNPYQFSGYLPGEVITQNSYELSIQSRCGDIWTTKFAQWFVANGGDALATQANRTTCDANCPTTLPESICCNTILGEVSLPFSYTAPRDPPCCSTCTFTAGDVQVYHWPVATSTPSITELVNTAGFTLYAPLTGFFWGVGGGCKP